MAKIQEKNNTLVYRPPVVVVMGHIDHGKSTLLDYIRKTDIVDNEAGGITQHVSAYETIYESAGQNRRVTFMDTPGHEAFHTLRSRGAKIADVAILVVSAEEGVKPQTVEAIKIIREQNIPFVVAINKIDRPNVNIDKTKLSLAENDVYVEGYGGTVSCVPVSAKTGQDIDTLLEVVFLTADLQELTGNPNAPATGIIIESKLNPRSGVSATLVIKDGSLKIGDFVAAGSSFTPVRLIENDRGQSITNASFSTPITIIGWNELVSAGAEFKTFSSKDGALEYAKNFKLNNTLNTKNNFLQKEDIDTLPVIIKADTLGSLEAIQHELKKLKLDLIQPKIISEGVGAIGEADVKTATGNSKKAVILGFNTKADNPAKILAERDGVSIEIFSIIYKLSERLEELLKERTPKIMIDKITGSARILRTFSRQKDKQIIGGKIDDGFLAVGETIKIIRRDTEIGAGKIRGMQQQKSDVKEVKAGFEFGAMVESKIEIVVGDVLRSFQTVEK